MNAVLTALLYIHQFSQFICALPCLSQPPLQPPKRLSSTRGLKNSKDNSFDVSVVEEIRRIMVNLRSNGEKKISADRLLAMLQRSVPQFRGNRQQDAHEFLRYVLDCTNSELQFTKRRKNHRTNATSCPNRKRSKKTIVQDIFGGSLQNEVKLTLNGEWQLFFYLTRF